MDAEGRRNVPEGYCSDCAVSQFEDDMMEYDREITWTDIAETGRLIRGGTRSEAQMKTLRYGIVMNQNGTKA